MTTHTPGPWKLHCMGLTEYDVIGTVPGHSGTFLGINAGNGASKILDADDQAEFDANVRLVGALPETAAERDRLKSINADLLEALEEAKREMKIAFNHVSPFLQSSIYLGLKSAIKNAGAAIARGGTTEKDEETP